MNPDLVLRDKEGKPYTVRYDQVNAMLLNEFLKEHRKMRNKRRHYRNKKRPSHSSKSRLKRLLRVYRR